MANGNTTVDSPSYLMPNIFPNYCDRSCVTVALGKSKTEEHLIHSIFSTSGLLLGNKLLCTEFSTLPQFTPPPSRCLCKTLTPDPQVVD